MEAVREFDAVIVANGDFPTHPIPLAVLQNAKHVVACDGAAAHFSLSHSLNPSISHSLIFSFPQSLNPPISHSLIFSFSQSLNPPISHSLIFSISQSLNPSFSIIGDGDSVPDEYRDRLIQIDEQDDNDLTKATRYCLAHHSPPATPQSPLRVAYLGCTGRREDHTLGNIALLMRYYREFAVQPTMFTDYGTFIPAHGNRTFPSFPGQQVSIFNFGCTRLDSEGLKWQSYAYREWWQGTLNEALANQFTLQADDYYIVYQTYESK